MSTPSDTENQATIAGLSSAKSIRVAKTGQVIQIGDLPEELRAVFEDYDADGDGVITTTELMEAAQAQKTLKVQNSLFRKGLIFTSALAVALVAVMGGMTYGIVDASKDTKVESRALMTKDEKPVGINLNEEDILLGSLAYMPEYVPAKIHEVTLKGPDGEYYYRTKKSIDITPEKSVTLTTLNGDIIAWDLEDGMKIYVTLSDGKTWSSSSVCTKCAATSLVADQDIFDAIETFYQAASPSRELFRGGCDE